MAEIRCSLLADGASDASLTPVLRWVVEQHAPASVVRCEWADLKRVPHPERTLAGRILQAIDLYPCDVLFVHRDAERQAPEQRYREIDEAITDARRSGFAVPHVRVVPVRMQEAWLLLDEAAIRRAAGNPNGRIPILLPPINRIEAIPDPKTRLYRLLRTASGLRGRRLKKFRAERAATLVVEFMRDFTCLRTLPAFQRMEAEVHRIAVDLSGRS
jgi:hypothetical protein